MMQNVFILSLLAVTSALSRGTGNELCRYVKSFDVEESYCSVDDKGKADLLLDRLGSEEALTALRIADMGDIDNEFINELSFKILESEEVEGYISPEKKDIVKQV
jgi:hypothetical protein